jgi:hypothetical protein
VVTLLGLPHARQTAISSSLKPRMINTIMITIKPLKPYFSFPCSCFLIMAIVISGLLSPGFQTQLLYRGLVSYQSLGILYFVIKVAALQVSGIGDGHLI